MNQRTAQRRSPADRRRGGGGEGLLGGTVSFQVRRLEPLLAWVLAAHTLWINIVFESSGMAFWLIAFFAACIGGWSRMFPARHQLAMFARGALLLAGGLILQVAAGAGAAMGPYAFWPPVLAVFYALLLSTRWALVLLVLALVEFGLACWLTLPVVPWRPVLAYLGVLAFIPSMALVFGRVLHQSDDNAESKLRDDRSLLYNEAGFFVHGAVLKAECHARERPFCMVLLNAADLLEIPALLGRRIANDLFAQVVRGIGAVSGEGIAARTDAVEFALLLPGVSADRAAALVRQQLGDPPKVELKFDATDKPDAKPIVIVLDLAIAQGKEKAQSIEDLYDELHARWTLPKRSDKALTKVPVLGPDDPRATGAPKVASPTVPMRLGPQLRPWDK